LKILISSNRVSLKSSFDPYDNPFIVDLREWSGVQSGVSTRDSASSNLMSFVLLFYYEYFQEHPLSIKDCGGP